MVTSLMTARSIAGRAKCLTYFKTLVAIEIKAIMSATNAVSVIRILRVVGNIPRTRIDISKATPNDIVFLCSYKQTLKGSNGMFGVGATRVP